MPIPPTGTTTPPPSWSMKSVWLVSSPMKSSQSNPATSQPTDVRTAPNKPCTNGVALGLPRALQRMPPPNVVKSAWASTLDPKIISESLQRDQSSCPTTSSVGVIGKAASKLTPNGAVQQSKSRNSSVSSMDTFCH